MKTTSTFFLILLLFTSCNKGNELYSMKQINNENKGKIEDIVSITFPDVIFIKTDKNKIIAKPKYDDLIKLHVEFYSKLNLNSFLYSVLNLQLNVPLKHIQSLQIKTFNIDNEMERKCNEKGIESIIKDFTYLKNGKMYLKKNFSNNDSDLTTEYLLYINKYLVKIDDYNALSQIEKRDELPLYIK